MYKANKISAFFFLGLFSLMMLHQIFPHVHNQHEKSHSHVAHSDHNHHHDHSSKENEESSYGFFDFFMDMHIHTTSSSEVVVFESNPIERHNEIDEDYSDSQFTIESMLSLDGREIDNSIFYHPPNIYFTTYLSCLDIRGPPALV
jgi:hypothetical protein